MTRFLTTTAVALALSTAAYAESESAVFSDKPFDPEVNLNASELIGMRVYASEASIENETTIAADGETEWDDIGEINEILLTRSGEVQSLIVGVGGFLGMGEKDVAIDMSEIRFVEEEGETDDFFLVIEADTVGIQDAPAYEYSQLTNTLNEADMDETDVAMENTADMGQTMDEDLTAWTGPLIERDGFDRVASAELTTEDLTGATVLGTNDESIGEVGKLLMTENGELDRAVIDVGGFLGMGEHHVAVPLDELTIMRTADGGDLRVYIDATQESLEAQPEYQG